MLEQISGWREHLRDLGTHEVKHGLKLQIYSLCKGELGNPALPRKARAKGNSAATSSHSRARSWVLTFAFAIVLTFAMRVLFNTLESTREAPLSLGETVFLFSLIWPIVIVGFWVSNRFLSYRTGKCKWKAKP